MELSFQQKVLLNLLLACLAGLSVLYPYLAILAAAVAIALTVNEIGEHNSEKLSFRNSVFEELRRILNSVRCVVHVVLVGSIIAHPVWAGKTDNEKKQLTGADDFASLGTFYKEVEYLNRLNTEKASKGIEGDLDDTYGGLSSPERDSCSMRYCG